MRAIIIACVLLVFAVAALLVVFFASRNGKRSGYGFLDYVKDPQGPEHMHAALAEQDAAIQDLAKKPPRQLVEMLLKDADHFGSPARAIKAAGPRVVPALLAAVNDPRFRARQKGAFGQDVEPLEGVLNCLEDFAPPEAIQVVLPLVSDEREAIRSDVALLLGSIGTVEAAAPLFKLLDDDDDYVRGSAVRGIDRALDAGRASETFRQIVFDGVARLVFRHSRSVLDDAPGCLLRLDRARAMPLLTDRERLVAGRENLESVLKALREAKVKVDEPQLLTILSGLEGRSLNNREERALGEVLQSLAYTGSPLAREAIERGLKHDTQRVREKAAQAKSILYGLDDPWAAAWDRRNAVGWDGLTAPQRHVLAVRMLIDEVNNGGFLQYFVNSSGDYWRNAVDGLAAIGATGDEALFSEALKFFGSTEPNADRDTRHRQVAVIAASADRPFEVLEDEFYDDKDDREVLLSLYMLEHADDFRGK